VDLDDFDPCEDCNENPFECAWDPVECAATRQEEFCTACREAHE
jgi:hypothetical protein